MPTRLSEIVQSLEDLAAYDGPWTPLRRETELLRKRVDELKQREERLDGMLIVALVGGSGVGKSTLLNAIAGDTLAEMSQMRPCTSIPTVYQPPGAQVPFEGWNVKSGSALENLIIIDTPDSDTIVKEHRERVIEALRKSDLILICGSPEKYLDEATWSLLRPLQGERTMVCVETKAALGDTVKDHWLQRLQEQGFEIAEYFRVDGRRTLDRKLNGRPPGDDEFDFPKLEHFMSQELDKEEVRRIKRSNATGLLTKTLDTLHDRVASKAGALDELERELVAAEEELLKESFEMVRGRLFAEPHLWNYALGREVSLRAKGIVGGIMRAVEIVRTLPARMVNWLPFGGRRAAGHQAAELLSDHELLNENVDLAAGQIANLYVSKHSELHLDFAKAGFDLPENPQGFGAFEQTLQKRIAHVLRGPARDRLIKRARILTSWPLAILCDLPIIAFLGFTCYRVVVDYVAMTLPPVFFLHALTVLLIILGVEIFLLSVLARIFAWSARRGAVTDLRGAFFMTGAAYRPEREALKQARGTVANIEELRGAVKD